MDGFEIPIGGDIAPFKQALAELTAAVRQLATSINAAMAPAQKATAEIAKSTRAVGAETKKASRGFVEMAKSAVGVITATAGVTGAIISVAAHIPQIIKLGRTIAFSLKEPITKAATETVSLGQKMREIMSSPAFKIIAGTAIGAGVAIGGTVIAARSAGAAFRGMKTIAGGVFGGIAAAAKTAGAAIRGAFSGVRSMIPSGGGGLLGPLAGVVGIGAALALVTSQLKSAFTAAAKFEDLQVRVESFTGSARAAKALLSELSRFGDVTPFETSDVQESGAKLLGAGIRENVAGLVKDLGAVSKNGQDLLELSDALGKGFTKGRFQTDDLDKFLQRGINLAPQLKAIIGLTGKAYTKAVEEGLKFNDVTKAISNMSAAGGQFNGLLARLSNTFNGIWSTFVSKWNDVRKAFAAPILDSLKPLLQSATAALDGLKEKAATAGKAIGDTLLTAFALIRSGQTMGLLKTGLAIAFHSAVDILRKGFRGVIAFMAEALPPILQAAFRKFRDPEFWSGVANVFKGAAHYMAAEIYKALGKADESRDANSLGWGYLHRGEREIANSGGNTDLAAVVVDAMEKGGKAFEEQIKAGGMSRGLAEALRDWKVKKASAGREVAALNSKAAVPPPTAGATGQGLGTSSYGDTTPGATGGGRGAPLVKSLTRIGGGGLGGGTIAPMVSQQVRTNRLLTSIDRRLKETSGPSKVTAVYA